MSTDILKRIVPLYDKSKHRTLVIEYDISDPHITRYGRSKYINHVKYYKRVPTLMDCYINSPI